MNVLFVTSELAGLAKSGGLGDVAAGLPAALRALGADIRVLLPAYRSTLAQLPAIDWAGRLPGRGSIPGCRIGQATLPNGLPLYLVHAPSLFDRPGTPYCTPGGHDWPDNHLRFARLSLAAAEIARGRGCLGWVPDLVHANDWPCGLAPGYLRWDGAGVPSLMTIHNIAYQGIVPATERARLAIPESAFGINGVEFHGAVSFLKAGLFYADHVATVSPGYAAEIVTPAHGAGLHGLLEGRRAQGDLTGIVNGLDDGWDPARDPYLQPPFSPRRLAGKRANAAQIRTSLCLRPSDGPLFGIVSRLVHQKGLDLVADCAHDIIARGGQIAILGLGNPDIEQMLSHAARQHRDDLAVLVGFNEPMAHRIIGGSDFLLMPSRFEPCGLTQMQAQRYGTLPIAHATGGLTDTIADGVTGFLFPQPDSDALMAACGRAFAVFQDAAQLAAMRQAAMAQSFGWSESAAAYAALYRRIAGSVVSLDAVRRVDKPHGAAAARSHVPLRPAARRSSAAA